MATKNNDLTSHEVKNQPRVIVEEDSVPSFAVDPKFIKVVKKNKISGFSGTSFIPGDDEDEFSEDPEEQKLLPAPEFNDILIKNNGAYENINSGTDYGTLYEAGGRSRVELEFKILIPEDLAGIVTGIEILQDDEVISSI